MNVCTFFDRIATNWNMKSHYYSEVRYGRSTVGVSSLHTAVLLFQEFALSFLD